MHVAFQFVTLQVSKRVLRHEKGKDILHQVHHQCVSEARLSATCNNEH